MTNVTSFPPSVPPAAPAPEFEPAPKHDWFRIIVFAAIIVFAGLFVATPAFHGTWLWDDDQEISANADVQAASGNLNSLKRIWTPGVVGADYLPVKTTFLWIEWKVFTLIGLRHDTTNPVDYQGTINIGYHVINALFHILNALLIWYLFYRLKIRWAWLGGFLFAIHPVLVESVAWVTEQKNTLSLIFMLLSIIAFINYDERGRVRDIIVSLLMFTLAALSKSAVIMLPFCFVLYVWWRDNKFWWRDLFVVGAIGGVYAALYGVYMAVKTGNSSQYLVYCTLIGLGVAAVCAAIWWLVRTDKERHAGRCDLLLVAAAGVAAVAVVGVISVLLAALSVMSWDFLYLKMILAGLCAVPFIVVWWMTKGSEWKRTGIFALIMVPFFAVAIGVALITVHWQFEKAIGAELIPVGGYISRIATAGMATWFYLWKCIWPFHLFSAPNPLSTTSFFDSTFRSGLIPIYQRWDVVHPTFMQLVVPWLAFFAVLALCIYKNCIGKQWGRHVILGLGFFFGNLVPALGIVMMSYMRITWVADHFVYISIIGVLGLVVAAASLIYDKIPAKGKPWYLGVGAAALFFLSFYSSFYSDRFLNESNMWLYTLSKNPDAWQAHSRFGKVLLDHQRTDDAFYHIQQSNRLRPDLAETNNNMGVLLLQKKRGAEGLPYFRRAVRLMPIGAFLFNYANALTQQGQGAEAVPAYEKLLRMNGGGYLAQVIKARGSSALETLFSERGNVTLGDLVSNNQNPALDRLLRNKLSAADYARVLPLKGGAALRELIQLHVSDQLDEMLKNKSADNLEQLVKNKGGKALEALLEQRGVLNDIIKQDGGDTVRAVFSMDAGNESFFGLRRARGSDAYEALVLAMRPDPLETLLALTGGDKLKQLLNATGSDMLMQFHAMENTEAHAIITDMMGGDPVMRLYEIIAAANAAAVAAGDPSQTVQKLAELGINDPSVVLTNYGAALLQAGRRDDAIRAYQYAIMIRPIPDAMVNYAMVLTQSGRGKEALPLFEKLLQVETYANNPMILSNAGIALAQAGRKDDAIRVLERALQINPNMADVQRNLELIKNAQPAAPAAPLQSAPTPIMPMQAPADASQMPIPSIFQNNNSVQPAASGTSGTAATLQNK